MKPLFRMQQLGVRLGQVQALSDCSLSIAPGERIALVGANGSGKTTLLRCLHGLVAPAGGVIESRPVRQFMVFQRPFVMRTSCLNNVRLGLWLSGRPWRDTQAQAFAALDRVGLGALAHRSARSLSGGQQQRLALARVWALQPEVLFLDEPTANLDPAGKHEVETLMSEFAGAGMTLIFSSHNLGQVKRLASRVIYLEQGRILVDAPTAQFFDKAQPNAARLFLQGELS